MLQNINLKSRTKGVLIPFKVWSVQIRGIFLFYLVEWTKLFYKSVCCHNGLLDRHRPQYWPKLKNFCPWESRIEHFPMPNNSWTRSVWGQLDTKVRCFGDYNDISSPGCVSKLWYMLVIEIFTYPGQGAVEKKLDTRKRPDRSGNIMVCTENWHS